MACPCRNRGKKEKSTLVSKIKYSNTPDMNIKNTIKEKNFSVSNSEKTEALAIDLEQCYLCAKKHIARAQIFFEEYHTGYPDHVKNLIESLRVSENEVRSAFLDWQKIMGQLDMAAGELLGNDPNSDTMQENHLIVARAIRAERLRLSYDPLYVPDFNELLVAIHTLQYKTLG